MAELKLVENNTHEEISRVLSEKYVNYEDVARILSLAISSGKNVLLWGPGGHAKSEMVEAAIQVCSPQSEVFIQSFGEGMDEATLWGGLDFKKLDEEKILQYFPENSFLNRNYAVFEELFDAPSSVLLALKDALTSKILRKGTQQFPMKTKCIIALTNKDPSEISELGLSAKALIERFPLQLKVEWKTYTSQDYLQLFEKVVKNTPDTTSVRGILAEILAKVSGTGDIISPRSAVHALQVAQTSAAMRGANRVEKEDLLDLRFIPGMESLANNIKQELEIAYERAQGEKRLLDIEADIRELKNQVHENQTPLKLLQAAKKAGEIQDKIAQLRVADLQVTRRNELRDNVSALIIEAQKLAMNNTRI
jgi:energy-coupling factor transporter ATP-binding protein EcfA2